MMNHSNAMNKSISLLLVLLLVFSFAPAALAADDTVTEQNYPTVNYTGKTENFVFTPGSDYTDTDLFGKTEVDGKILFDGFKGVMPGDVVNQKVIVKNTSGKTVKIYMRAITHDEQENPLSEKVAAEETVTTMQDFLSKLHMTVKHGEGETATVLFNASPEKLDGLKENVLLGKLKSGLQTELNVELTVPMELGNEYANRIGEVDWVFTVEEVSEGGGGGDGDGGETVTPEPPEEEIPDPDVPKGEPTIDPEDPEEPVIEIPGEPVPQADKPELPGDAPKTGDTTRILLWVVVLLMAGVGLAAVRKAK